MKKEDVLKNPPLFLYLHTTVICIAGPLTKEQKENNRMKSKLRSCVGVSEIIVTH